MLADAPDVCMELEEQLSMKDTTERLVYVLCDT